MHAKNTNQVLIAPDFLGHQHPRVEVMTILGLSSGDWEKLELYSRVHTNEFYLLMSELKIRPQSILEWGSGFSTFILCHYGREWGTRYFLSLDHNEIYQRECLKRLHTPAFFEAKTVDLTGGIWPWDPTSHNYATYPTTLGRKFELIFVDGRRRNECLLVASRILNPGGIVIVHDIWRQRYQVGMSLFRETGRYDLFAIMTLDDKASCNA